MKFPKVPAEYHHRFHGLEWKKVPTPHRLFLEVPLLISNFSTNMTTGIDHLTELFGFQGTPLTVFTDNGTPRNGAPPHTNMASNLPLQLCTTLSSMASLKGLSTQWKAPSTRPKLPEFLCLKHWQNSNRHKLVLIYKIWRRSYTTNMQDSKFLARKTWLL